MEALVIVGAIVVAVFINAALSLDLVRHGYSTWNPEISRGAKTLWGSCIASAAVILGLMFGVGALVTLWPFWLLVALISIAYFGIRDLRISRGSVVATPLVAAPPAPMTWDALWRSYEGRELPPWMLQQALGGQVRYDGKLARVHQGMLVPQPTAPPATLDGVFDRLDRLLGG